MRFFPILAVICSFAGAASAFDTLNTRSDLMDLIGDKTIKIGLYGLRLNVRDDGTISGKAIGGKITGDWTWQDGYFCRTMFWGNRKIAYNCQLVEVQGRKIRFTTDKGAGDSATFRIVD